MALYLGNDEVSQRISLANVKGTNLPEITEETSGMFLSNNGTEIAWSEVETTVDTVLNGWSLLDHKFSDHILEDESWIRGDSFDWKDGTVYTSAYEHLLADYNNGEDKHDYRASNINIIGELDDDKGVISGFSASNYASVKSVSSFNPGSNPWEISLKLNLSNAQFINGETILSYGDTFPIIHLGLTSWGSFSIKMSSNGVDYDIVDTTTMGYGLSKNENVVVKLKFTGSQYSISYSKNNQEFQTDITIDSTQPIFNSDALMYLGCQGNIGNPFTGAIDLKECYIKINGLDWWEGADTIKYRLSADGHKICNYVQENAIQNVYELNGVAWYYIIDTINSKFKLPRTKWNFVGLRNAVGDYVAESLPNITGRLNYGDTRYTTNNIYEGSFSRTDETVKGDGFTNGTDSYIIDFNASLSSSTYQDNAPVQQRATEMYLYFYVGDVVRNTSIINVSQFGERMIAVENTVANVESTVEQHMEEVNTTISEYKEEVNTTVANIESSVENKLDTTQITNCITEIPQDIKLELKDGVLTLKAGSKLYQPNGFEEDGTTKKFDEYIVQTDRTYTSPISEEATLVMFITGFGGFTGISKNVITSGSTIPTTGVIYNTDTNIISFYRADVVEWTNGTFPIAIIKISSEGVISSIEQVFNGFGYIGSTVFALPGVKGLIPNGRNVDGSLKNVEVTTSKVFIHDTYIGVKSILHLTQQGTITATPQTNYIKQTPRPTFQKSACWEDTTNNIIWKTIASSTYWEDGNRKVLNLGKANYSDGKITELTINLPYRAVDQNDMETKANIDLSNILANIDYVVESKLPTTEDPTWYRVYKSGWVEQGGLSGTIPGNGGLDIVFPKQMTNNLYNVSLVNADYNIPQIPGVNRMTTKMNVDYQSASYEGKVIWEVKGQGA